MFNGKGLLFENDRYKISRGHPSSRRHCESKRIEVDLTMRKTKPLESGFVCYWSRWLIINRYSQYPQ